MLRGNELVSQDAVERLQVKEGECVLAVGPGNGHAIDKILSYQPSKVFGIKISGSFKENLKNKFGNQRALIFANDAKELKNVVGDSSVEKLLVVNAIHFLDLLESYVKVFYRVINKDGEGIIAYKLNGIASFADNVPVNKDIEFVTSSFERGDFLTSHIEVGLRNDFSKYTAIFIKK